HFPVGAVHAYRGEDALERRVFPFAFLAHDLLARGLRRRHGLQRGVLNVLSRITQAVILPHRRLRQVSKRIVEVALDVRGQLPDVQIAVQFRALRKRFGVAELAHVSSVLVEDDDQVWLAQRRYGNFSFGEGEARISSRPSAPRFTVRSPGPTPGNTLCLAVRSPSS